ncbi:tyrosine-type recombinase/integrase [Paucidesulfovibrio longus]|uniref:tyrosine-type recombinase/integrase n=1 Tax=Paucidesulfovibrio longus TaxID=889 RepID=UPI0004823AE3|nr:site-specific integrase [Paucidesulfovibrio longus]
MEESGSTITIKFAFFTGFRRVEVFGLRWDNVSMERGCVRLVDTKGGKDSVLPLNSGAMDALRESLKLFGPSFSPYAFPGKSGKERKDIRTAWDRAKMSAGIAPDFRFHGLRHNFASHLASSGQVSMLALQRLLTHKSPQMTQRYAHLLDEELRRSVELMELV